MSEEMPKLADALSATKRELALVIKRTLEDFTSQHGLIVTEINLGRLVADDLHKSYMVEVKIKL